MGDYTIARRQAALRQRRAYALRRMSQAVDRIINRPSEALQAAKWAKAWARKAGIKT